MLALSGIGGGQNVKLPSRRRQQQERESVKFYFFAAVHEHQYNRIIFKLKDGYKCGIILQIPVFDSVLMKKVLKTALVVAFGTF